MINTQHEALPFAIIKQLPNSLVLVFDRDFRYLFAEGEAFFKNGMNPEFFIGKTVHESFPPEEVFYFLPFYLKVLEGEKKQYEHIHSGRTFLHNFFPYYNNIQEVIGGIVISQDITEIKIIQTQLLQSEQRYDLAMNSSHTGIFDWNGITETIYRSLRVWEIFEINENERSSSYPSLFQFVHPDDIGNILEIYKSEFTNERFAHDFRIITPNKNLKWIHSSGMLLRNESGKIERIVGRQLQNPR